MSALLFIGSALPEAKDVLLTDEAPGFSPPDRIVKVITSSRRAGLSDFAV